MFGHRFLVHSCDVFLDVFGVKEASDGEPSDAGIVDVQEERLGECGLVSLRSYPCLNSAASGIDCQERAAGNGTHPRKGPVVDRQEALRIQSVELRKRSYALRFYLRSKSRDGVENADDDFVCKNEKGLLQQLRGQAHLRPEVEADRVSFRILEVGAIEQLGDPFRERDLAFLVVDLNVLEQRRGILLPHLGHFPTRGPERLVGICTPYRYKFPLSARDLFSSLEAVSSIPNNLSTFPLVTCNFPNLQKRLIELFPPVK